MTHPSMKQITLNIPENKFAFVMQLIQSLGFIQVADNETQEKPYNPEFVAKVRKSEQEFEEGKFISLKQEDFKQFLGL